MSKDTSVLQFSAVRFAEKARAMRWWWLGLPLVLGLAFAAVSMVTEDNYTAITVLSPNEEDSGGLGQLAGSLGGLAGLAGVDLGSMKTNNTQLAIELMRSRSFLYPFIERNELTKYLLAYEAYDADSGQVTFKDDVYRDGEWVREVEAPRTVIPEPWEAYGELLDRLTIVHDATKGIVTVELSYIDPSLAARWLQNLVTDINNVMRARESEQVSESIQYLSERAEQADYAELKTALYNLLQEQYKKDMLIAVKDDYVFEVVDPAQPPHFTDGLPALVWFVVGLMLAGFFLLVVNVLRSYELSER